MKEEHVQLLCIKLISTIASFLLEHHLKDTEALKIIRIAIDDALYKNRKEKK